MTLSDLAGLLDRLDDPEAAVEALFWIKQVKKGLISSEAKADWQALEDRVREAVSWHVREGRLDPLRVPLP